MFSLGILRNVGRTGGRFIRPYQGLPALLTREPTRNFSTVGSEEEAPSSDSSPEPRTSGFAYGKLNGIARHTLKADVIHFFEGFNLTNEDIKVVYTRSFSPFAMILQFSSYSAFDAAVRLCSRKRIYRLEKAGRLLWNQNTTFDGKAVLLQGIPRDALLVDLERFLCGCAYDASNVKFFVRAGFPDPIKLVVVCFPSQVEAMNAYRAKNRSFCLNSSIRMRVLQ